MPAHLPGGRFCRGGGVAPGAVVAGQPAPALTQHSQQSRAQGAGAQAAVQGQRQQAVWQAPAPRGHLLQPFDLQAQGGIGQQPAHGVDQGAVVQCGLRRILRRHAVGAGGQLSHGALGGAFAHSQYASRLQQGLRRAAVLGVQLAQQAAHGTGGVGCLEGFFIGAHHGRGQQGVPKRGGVRSAHARGVHIQKPSGPRALSGRRLAPSHSPCTVSGWPPLKASKAQPSLVCNCSGKAMSPHCK